MLNVNATGSEAQRANLRLQRRDTQGKKILVSLDDQQASVSKVGNDSCWDDGVVTAKVLQRFAALRHWGIKLNSGSRTTTISLETRLSLFSGRANRSCWSYT